jgi:hypothetical protein
MGSVGALLATEEAAWTDFCGEVSLEFVEGCCCSWAEMRSFDFPVSFLRFSFSPFLLSSSSILADFFSAVFRRLSNLRSCFFVATGVSTTGAASPVEVFLFFPDC